jgi:putative transcriptional regulator
MKSSGRFASTLFLAFAALLLALPARAQEDPANSIFLVAKRHLTDPNFRESVVLVTQHAQGSPVGVIVNRPTKLPLAKIFPENAKLADGDDLLFFGGPVLPQLLVYVFRSDVEPKDALRVLSDVYMSFNSEMLGELLKRPKPTQGLRVFAGYSGWGPGQLQREIAQGDWYVVRAEAEIIFRSDPAAIWEEMIKRATAKQVRGPVNLSRLAAR